MEWIDLDVCRGQWFENDLERVAVLLPGSVGAGAQPLLWYTRAVLSELGWSVLSVWDEWDGESDRRAWVEARAEAALERVPDAQHTFLVGKSISTLAAGIAADRALPAVWLTPALVVPELVALLERASAPTLLVGGTGDEVWDADVAERLPADVFEIAGADHSMGYENDAFGSIEVMRAVVERVADFADAV
jgi:pimeloyl-ACP methyl ester carboxylesterase